MVIQSAVDIAGGNAAVALAAAPRRARRIFLTATGSSNARFGDANVTATRGVALQGGVMEIISASDGDIGDAIDLSEAFVYLPTGTTLSIAWGV